MQAKTSQYLQEENGLIMSISTISFSSYEEMIQLGVVDAVFQRKFISALQDQPNLALDCDEFGTSLLMVAAYSRNIVALEALIQYGANLNAVNDCGESALVNVVRLRVPREINHKVKYDIVSLLLLKGQIHIPLHFRGVAPYTGV